VENDGLTPNNWIIFRCFKFEKRRASRNKLSIRDFNTASDVSSFVVVGV